MSAWSETEHRDPVSGSNPAEPAPQEQVFQLVSCGIRETHGASAGSLPLAVLRRVLASSFCRPSSSRALMPMPGVEWAFSDKLAA